MHRHCTPIGVQTLKIIRWEGTTRSEDDSDVAPTLDRFLAAHGSARDITWINDEGGVIKITSETESPCNLSDPEELSPTVKRVVEGKIPLSTKTTRMYVVCVSHESITRH